MAVRGARVVVLRALGLGDLCASVPALRAIARANGHAPVVLAAPAALAPLAPLVHEQLELFPHAGLVPLPPELHRTDLAINLHGRGPRSTALLQATRPRDLIAFGLPRASTGVVVEWRSDEHERDRWCRLLDGHGIGADPHDLRLGDPAPWPRPHSYLTVVHPGAAARSRRWPARRWAHVAGALRTRGHEVVVTGAASERRLATAIAETARLGDDAVLAGRTDVGALASLVAAAGLVVSGDTGVAHLGFAYRRPSVTLYGPVAPSEWGPPASGPHVALWAGRVGDPHGTRRDPGLLQITVDAVLDACSHALARGGHRAPR